MRGGSSIARSLTLAARFRVRMEQAVGEPTSYLFEFSTSFERNFLTVTPVSSST